MRRYRNLKISSVIEEELGKLLEREFDFDGALVTIVDVFVDTDLLQACVKLGIIPVEKGPETFFKIEKRKKELQHELLRKLNIKPMPRLRFEISNPQEN